MKAVIFNKGLAALVFSDSQRFIVSAVPMERGGFSIGIDDMRISIADNDNRAREKVRKTLEFFTTTIMEVE